MKNKLELTSNRENLTPELKALFKLSLDTLEETLRIEVGPRLASEINRLHQLMSSLKTASLKQECLILDREYKRLSQRSASERMKIARAFALMLELLNSCELAYRTHRLALRHEENRVLESEAGPITFVLTAHPTEARSSENIEIFHRIQNILTEILQTQSSVRSQLDLVAKLRYSLALAWKTPIVREVSPTVADEARHIVSLLLRDEIVFSFLESFRLKAPIYIRNWAGGDKDGHPGVDQNVMLQSLQIARDAFLGVWRFELEKLENDISLTRDKKISSLSNLKKSLVGLESLRSGDGGRIKAFQAQFHKLVKELKKEFHSTTREIDSLARLLHVFPALVIPLELRESSDVLAQNSKRLPIDKMLEGIKKVAQGGSPTWYAKIFIVSMTESFQDLQNACVRQRRIFGEVPLPVVPLFENAKALAAAEKIATEALKNGNFKSLIQNVWAGRFEIMVGYSDSSKESGALASRLAIAEALPWLEKLVRKHHVTPVFFHGSGGSIDRGGGSIEEQIAWWPESALKAYKVTVQGEMIERNFASHEIARRQIQKIRWTRASRKNRQPKNVPSAGLKRLSILTAENYQNKIKSQPFLDVVEKATPYSFLNLLKIGSRPSKRAQKLEVSGLRAIPWILCWTQTRTLFPTWWGIGSSWAHLSRDEQRQVKADFKQNMSFRTYVRALGFTLAKVELAPWRMYLKESGLKERESIFRDFENEFRLAKKTFHAITQEKSLMYFRPWLGESIKMRSPLIHPLNLLQILGAKKQDDHLIRITMAGISSGMLTTG